MYVNFPPCDITGVWNSSIIDTFSNILGCLMGGQALQKPEYLYRKSVLHNMSALTISCHYFVAFTEQL